MSDFTRDAQRIATGMLSFWNPLVCDMELVPGTRGLCGLPAVAAIVDHEDFTPLCADHAAELARAIEAVKERLP